MATPAALLLWLLLPRPAGAFPYALTPEQEASVAEHLPFGLPSAGELLFRRGYVACHDNWLKIPRWVAYHVSAATLEGPARRGDDFRADGDLKPWQRAEPADYRRSGYDQGHMAPAAAMRRGEEAMSESFLLSNMVPQVGAGFNRGVWRALEDKVRDWALERGEGWVFAGPAFDDSDGDGVMEFELIGPGRVAVPPKNFMILVSRDREGTLDAIAFLLPNARSSVDRLPSFIVSVREIERLTGLDFLDRLPDATEDELEERRPPAPW